MCPKAAEFDPVVFQVFVWTSTGMKRMAKTLSQKISQYEDAEECKHYAGTGDVDELLLHDRILTYGTLLDVLW